MTDRIESTEFENDYEGLTVECPFCDPDDVGYQPRPFLSSGSCHECGRQFDVIARWETSGEANHE